MAVRLVGVAADGGHEALAVLEPTLDTRPEMVPAGDWQGGDLSLRSAVNLQQAR